MHPADDHDRSAGTAATSEAPAYTQARIHRAPARRKHPAASWGS